MKPRIKPLTKTGDADHFEIHVQAANGRVWREIYSVSGFYRTEQERIRQAWAGLAIRIRDISRWKPAT